MKSFFIILFLGFSSIFYAQKSISGTISDTKKQVLSGVIVTIPELNISTISDQNGNYFLSDLPSKQLKITFSFLGHISQTKTIDLTKSNPIFDILLDEATFQMDEVIVSTAFNKVQSQNVMKVEHQSMSDLKQKGSTTLIEGLATIPGVSQISTGVSIGKPVIRGLSANRVLVYSQGVRIENQQFGDEHGLGLNDAGVESVEVIKGPASLLYGSDAIGGVLYFNPEKFADPKTLSTDFSQRFFSNTLGTTTTIGLKTSTNNWKFLSRGSYSEHSDYQLPNKNRVTNTRFNEKDFKTGIGYSNAKFSSVLRYNFNALDIGILEKGIDEQTKSRNVDFPKQGVANHLLSLNNSLHFEKSKLDLNLGYIANNRKEFAENNTPNLFWKLKTINYDLKFHLPKYGKLETIIGSQGMFQTNKNFGLESLIPDAKTIDYGFFGTTNYQWKKNVLQVGLRFDNRKVATNAMGIFGEEDSFLAVEKKFNSFNGSLGYKTNLKENLILRLNLASGFRAPNLSELTSNGIHEGTFRYEIGNPDLTTEQNFQADLNLEYKTDHFEFFANGFYNLITNYIYVAPNGNQIDDVAVYDYLQNDATLYGGEIGLHFHPHPFDSLHFDSSFENVTGKKADGKFLPLLPAKNFNNTIRTDFNIKKWLSGGFASINILHSFEQNNFSEFETKTKDYTLFNLGFGGKIKLQNLVFNLNINANNIFDKIYISHLSRLKSEGIPNIGRNIIFGFDFKI
jgi:iron complex outermembrane recepter protein